MNDLTGKVCLVTGASSGIGFETAKALAVRGAEVVMVSRASGDGAEKAAELKKAGDNVTFMPADLSSMQEARALARDFKAAYPRLDVLVNNAGLFANERKTTVDGYELTFALNHLAYFLLTNLLIDVLKKSSPARVINVASEAERMGKIHFDDLMLEKNYNGWKAYGQSKLANLLFTFELARRLEGMGVSVNALHPGAVATGFGQDAQGFFMTLFKLFRPFFRSAEKGAETPIYLATSAELEGVSGKYFKDKAPIEAAEQAYDREAQTKLWRISEDLSRLRQEESPFVEVAA